MSQHKIPEGYCSVCGNLKSYCDHAVGINLEYPEDYKEFETPTEVDMVNKPSHYRINENTQVLDVIKHALTREQYKGYLIGNCLKYSIRANYKGNAEEDLRKMNYYANELELELDRDKNLIRESNVST